MMKTICTIAKKWIGTDRNRLKPIAFFVKNRDFRDFRLSNLSTSEFFGQKFLQRRRKTLFTSVFSTYEITKNHHVINDFPKQASVTAPYSTFFKKLNNCYMWVLTKIFFLPCVIMTFTCMIEHYWNDDDGQFCTQKKLCNIFIQLVLAKCILANQGKLIKTQYWRYYNYIQNVPKTKTVGSKSA